MKKINHIILAVCLISSLFLSSCGSTSGFNAGAYREAISQEVKASKTLTAEAAVDKILKAASGEKLYLNVYVLRDDFYTFTKALRSRKDITIYLNLTVDGIKNIPPKAFQNSECLKYISIEGPITTIERKAFAGCTRLGEVILPDTVRYIDQSAFLYCMSLFNINISEETQKAIHGTDFFVSPLSVDVASEVLAKHTSGDIDLDVFIEDNLDVVALLDELTFLPSTAYVNLTLSLASDMEEFNKRPFLQDKHIKELHIEGSAKVVNY